MGELLNWLQGAMERVRAFAYSPPRWARQQAARATARPRVGVALGGGFARGIAHIGVLKVLEENAIPIDCIAGTSVGALIATAYASGLSLDEMARHAEVTRFKDFGRWTLSWLGLATNERLEDYLHRHCAVTRFDELKIPLAIAATDLGTAQPVYFTEGELGPPLRASCAYPGLFLPVEYRGRIFVDGFLTAPVPVEAVRQLGAEFVIAVHLESSGQDERPRNVAEVIGRSFAIMQSHANHTWQQKSDLVIEPGVAQFPWDDFQNARRLVAAGEVAALRALPQIRAALKPQERLPSEIPAQR